VEQRVVPGLAWFSLGLGLAQLAAPGRMAKLVGVRDNDDTRTLMRVVGAREVACGVGLLRRAREDNWLGARVAGDLMDLALLGGAMRGRRVRRSRVVAAMAMVLGITAVDVFGALKVGRHRDEPYSPTSRDRMMATTKSVVVNRPPEEVYQFWLNFENFPRFMKHVESVTMLGHGRSHWKARGPAGKLVEWDAEVVENRPNELIAWRSLPGAEVDNAGSVRFERAPGGRGTLVRVNLRYDPPAGSVGTVIASLFGSEPGQEVEEDLRRFKQVMETGEVVRSDASIHERPHPARPPERPVPLQPAFRTQETTRPSARAETPERTQAATTADRRADAETAASFASRGGPR